MSKNEEEIQGLDLQTLAVQDDTAEMEIMHPVDNVPIKGADGKAMTLSIRSKQHKLYKAKEREIQNRKLKSKALARNKIKITAEELEADAKERRSVLVTGWSSNFKFGDVTKFTPANLELVLDALPWLTEQIEDFADDLENFT